MANGFAPYLLQHISSVNLNATPDLKIETPGFISLLKKQKAPISLGLPTGSGHKKTMQIKYMPRLTEIQTDTAKSCDYTVNPVYLESSVSLSSTRQIAIYLDDITLAQYEADASKTVMQGTPATPLMNELWKRVQLGASAILNAMDRDLLTTAVANVGVNAVTGVNTATTVNITQNMTNNILTAGIPKILADYNVNEFSGRPQIVGSGLMLNYAMQKPGTGLAMNGLNNAYFLGEFDFFHDQKANTVLGTNEILVYEPDAVQLVEYMEYEGAFAGDKGVSTFFTIPVPYVQGGVEYTVKFDAQLKYYDCPTTLTDSYYGTTLSLNKGWNLILSKQAGLWTVPSNAYQNADPLTGNKGSLRYALTNS